MRAQTSSFALALLIALAGAPASAEEGQPDYAAAKRHYKAGQQQLQTDHYAEAIVEFRKAYEITKDGLVMGKVAEAFARAGDFENALAAIKTYRSSASLSAADQTSADALIKEYEKAVKEGRSKHLVLPGEVVEKPPEQPKPEAPTPPPPPEQPHKTRRLWTWVAAGTAGALAITALVLGLNAQSKYDELKDQCQDHCFDRQSDIDSVRSRAIATDVLWGVAAAAAVTSVVLFFVEGRQIKKETKEPGGSDEEETTTRRFQLNPIMRSGRYGLNAGFRF
jgi:hypothetical protein